MFEIQLLKRKKYNHLFFLKIYGLKDIQNLNLMNTNSSFIFLRFVRVLYINNNNNQPFIHFKSNN
jgi:hypothetical protein